MNHDEVKNLREELQLARKELQDFVYIISHDIKAPVRNIKVFTHRFGERISKNLTEKERQYFKFIKDAAEEMNLLLDGVTEYSRIVTIEEDEKEIDINDLMKFVLIELSELIKSTSSKITIKDELPTIVGKPKLMHKLFKNLIQNAILFNNNVPDILIDYKCEKKEVIFSVKDNGIGISENYFGKIFGIFKRLDEKEFTPGIGLGLAICKRIIQVHKGKIWLESEVGKGSIFYISIIK